ncbi:MAG TPA: MFS transporter [Gaiellaceae bacterium]|nr:MFS transporter [Gaiellaceae bacterium]
MGGVRTRLREGAAAARAVVANRDLRRLQVAGVGSVLGNWAYVVGLLVYAYADGGVAAVGLVTVLRMLPAALAAPLTSVLADRYSRRGVMIASDVARAALMALVALVIFQDGPAWAVYALVTASAITATAFRPAQAALLPALARTPAELTAANVAASAIASAGSIAGPALGAALLAVSNVELLFLFNALTFVWSGLVLLGVGEPAGTARVRRARNPVGREALAGFGALARDGGLRFLTVLYAAQTVVGGALGVVATVTAFDLLDGGDSEVGLLYTAFGVGGLVGGAVALALVGRRRLAGDFGLGLLLFGGPLALVPVVPALAPVLVLYAAVGIGNTLVDVAATTLLQRSVADDVLARAFGTLQSLLLGAMAVGSLLAPLLVEGIGADAALVALGVALPLLALASLPRLRAIDARGVEPTRELELLLGSPLFAPLPPRTLEQLASVLEPVEAPAGTVLVHAGDHGDRYYLVAEGRVRVEPVEAEATTLGPGEGFGEIALLRDVPRTATVTALEDCRLYTLERDDFLAAVTGSAPSLAAAHELISTRLAAGPLAPETP